jgi:hypothetical protein
MKMEQPGVRVSPVQIEQNMDYLYHAMELFWGVPINFRQGILL